MTVRQLLGSLDSAELTEWMAFLKVEAETDRPAGDDEAWRRAFNAYG
jgi:hypothetical protein